MQVELTGGKSKSLATVVTEDMLKPTRRIGADSIVMQSTFADDRKMQDQGFKGIINYIDYATRVLVRYSCRCSAGICKIPRSTGLLEFDCVQAGSVTK